MAKQKTHSSSKKRFKVTGTGKVKRSQAYKKHILNKKTTKRKRKLRQIIVASEPDTKRIRRLIPYR
ncbi:MAG: 50S ribosomal protein L35 [Clostridiaceae bacterium]|nr:50S ribosomal protein L35 [Clostridiaceae bacterium]